MFLKSNKLNRDCADNNSNQIVFLSFLIVSSFLLSFYLQRINTYNVVWELEDEAGYFWNAAFFNGINWDSIAGQSYYGFGYSVFLIPGFWICKNGIELTVYSHIINVLFDYGAFVFLTKITCSVMPVKQRAIAPVLSVLPVLTPHIVGQTYETTCESCLFFFAVFIFYQFYKITYYYSLYRCIALMISLSFIFFVHTRCVGIIIPVMIITIIIVYRDKKNRKYIGLMMATFIAVVVSLYIIKLSIIDYKSSYRHLILGKSGDINNIITIEFIINRLLWLKKDWWIYITSFIAKSIYSFYSSCGLLSVVFVNTVRSIKCKTRDAFSWLSLSIFFSWLVTVLLCVINGTGHNATTFLYGRYYEHLSGLIILIGCITLLKGDVIKKYEVLWSGAFIGAAALKIVLHTFDQKDYVSIQQVDNNRIASIGFLVDRISSAGTIMTLMFLSSMIMLVLCSLKSETRRIIIVPVLFLALSLNTSAAIRRLNETIFHAQADVALANYLYSQGTNRSIVMIDDDSFRYPGFYSRMQVLLMDYRIDVLRGAEISHYVENVRDEWFLLYNTSPLKSRIQQKNIVLEGQCFCLCRISSGTGGVIETIELGE